MRTFTVEGADRATGREVVISIDAPTRELAEEELRERGIVVAEIRERQTEIPTASRAGGHVPHYGRPAPAPGKPGSTLMLAGAAVAGVGAIMATIGFGLHSSEGARYGTTPAWAGPLGAFGAIVLLLGLLVFAAGRIRRSL